MCGRYTLKARGVDLQRELHLDHEPVLEARYNIAPTQAAPVQLDTAPRELTLARWGFTPRWAKTVAEGARHINARSEGLPEQRLFHDAFEHRRCLVPCDGFFEWKHHGRQATPLYVEVKDHPLQTMAGLWTSWRSGDGLEVITFTIVTRAADAFMQRIHTRMPLFLGPQERSAWLDPATPSSTVKDLLTQTDSLTLTATEVSHRVNSVAFDDPRCLEPASAVQLDLL